MFFLKKHVKDIKSLVYFRVQFGQLYSYFGTMSIFFSVHSNYQKKLQRGVIFIQTHNIYHFAKTHKKNLKNVRQCMGGGLLPHSKSVGEYLI